MEPTNTPCCSSSALRGRSNLQDLLGAAEGADKRMFSPRVLRRTNCIPRANGLSCSATDLQGHMTRARRLLHSRVLGGGGNLRPDSSFTDLSVTMMAEGWAQAVISVTMKRKMRKGMRVLQVRSHFPDTAWPFSFRYVFTMTSCSWFPPCPLEDGVMTCRLWTQAQSE